MSSSTDVLSARVTATGTVVPARTRLRGLLFVNTATAGSMIFRDGSASGPILLQIDTPAQAGLRDYRLPGNGILFGTNVHVTLSNVTSLTVFHG